MGPRNTACTMPAHVCRWLTAAEPVTHDKAGWSHCALFQTISCTPCKPLPAPADYVLSLPHVYFVSARQLLAWLRRPSPAAQLTPAILGCGNPGGAGPAEPASSLPPAAPRTALADPPAAAAAAAGFGLKAERAPAVKAWAAGTGVKAAAGMLQGDLSEAASLQAAHLHAAVHAGRPVVSRTSPRWTATCAGGTQGAAAAPGCSPDPAGCSTGPGGGSCDCHHCKRDRLGVQPWSHRG